MDNQPFDEQAIRSAQAELARVESVRPQVRARIAATRPKPASFGPLSAAALVIVLVGSWFVLRRESRPPSAPAPLPLAQVSSVQVGPAEITEHFSAMLNSSTVLVVWSSNDRHRFQADSSLPGASQYNQRLLHAASFADGRTITCTLFVAQPGILPALQPPSVYAAAGRGTVVCLSTSPRLTSATDLPNSLRTCGIQDQSAIRAIIDQIHSQLH